MDHNDKPWSVPVAVADIADTGSHYELTADPAARDAVAQLAGLRSLDRLEAVFDLARQGDDVVVRGEVRARVGQTCVVTLEPIENDVMEVVDLVFAPAVDAEPGGEGAGKRNKNGEPPEPLSDGVIDLGVVAAEFLVLGLEPYPRKPGAEFTSVAAGDERANPFAALEALKKRP